MNVTLIHKLDTPGYGCNSLKARQEGVNLILECYYDGANDRDEVTSITFSFVRAYSFTDEAHSHGYRSEAYDAVVSIEQSDWLQSLTDSTTSARQSAVIGAPQHFAVFVSNSGYYQVVASSCTIAVRQLESGEPS